MQQFAPACTHALQTLREIASNAQAAASSASLQAKEECEARQQLTQQLELKTSQNASLMAEGSVSQLLIPFGHQLVTSCR